MRVQVKNIESFEATLQAYAQLMPIMEKGKMALRCY
jgi:hypothetical protein